MRKLYAAIGVGLIASLPFLYSCGNKEDYSKTQETQQVQVLSPLEEKLQNVVNNVRLRLLEKEIKYGKEYYDFISEQLKAQELIPFDRGCPWYMSAQIDAKLSTKKIYGLKNDYVVTEATPLSDEAQIDITEHKRFEADLREYLQKVIGQRPVTKNYFKGVIWKYVETILPKECVKRGIAARFWTIFENEFNILPHETYERRLIDGYNQKAIDDAFKRIK